MASPQRVSHTETRIERLLAYHVNAAATLRKTLELLQGPGARFPAAAPRAKPQ